MRGYLSAHLPLTVLSSVNEKRKLKREEVEQRGTHDNLFPEPIVDFSHECFQYENTHQQTPQSHSASCNNRDTSRNFNIPLTLITSMYSINPISITSRLFKVEISDVFRSESTNGNRLAASCTPLNCEFTFSDPPVCCECCCVERED